MNEQLPYEHKIIQKLETLPLPDENVAWIDMCQRLDEKDDDHGVIIPPLKGCGLFAVIGIALLLIGSIFFGNKIFKHQNIITKNDAGKQIEKRKPLNNNSFIKTRIFDSLIKNHDTITINKSKSDIDINTLKINTQQQLKTIEKKNLSSKQYQRSLAAKRNNIANNRIKVEEEKRKSIPGKQADKISVDTSANNQDYFKHPDSLNAFNNNTDSLNHQSDTALKKIIAQTNQDSSNNNKKKKEKTLKQHNISFGAGLAIHQQLPVAGQTFVPYNAEGRKCSLLDYLPSVFFKTYYKQKFFLQLGFRYGAPQLTKQLMLNSRTVVDTSFSVRTITTTSTTLKKTYYHQSPVSINYNVIPKLSIGAGVIWNRFNSAVVQQDSSARNVDTNDTMFNSKIMTVKKADSAFNTTYLQAMIEADYHWKRFSLGMMYAKGLQPYIQFRSSGVLTQEKNSSLQIFLRYELWRSKRKID